MHINPLSDVSLTSMFSHSVSCLFILSMVSFVVPKLFSLMLSYLFIVFFFPLAQRDISETKILVRDMFNIWLLMFSSFFLMICNLWACHSLLEILHTFKSMILAWECHTAEAYWLYFFTGVCSSVHSYWLPQSLPRDAWLPPFLTVIELFTLSYSSSHLQTCLPLFVCLVPYLT